MKTIGWACGNLLTRAFSGWAAMLMAGLVTGCGYSEARRIQRASENEIVGSFELQSVRSRGTNQTPLEPFAHLEHCRLHLAADHAFSATEIPSAELTKIVSITGTWSLKITKTWDTRGYYLMLFRGGLEIGRAHV